jgi:tRNA-uridine 2-sulfurtransferase
MSDLSTKNVIVQGYGSEAALDAALTDARGASIVNSQRLFTCKRPEADERAPSEMRALNTHEHLQKSTIVVGASGGVDSSVSAMLLKEQGYSVICLFMKNWEEETLDGACTTEQDFDDVRRVADKLKIPYYVSNFSEEYRKSVFDNFLSLLKLGKTPNPDILCNREIKFKCLLDAAKNLGASALATGHYAQIGQKNGIPTLLKGNDPTKDQSYFLYTISSKILPSILFPVGHLKKSEVRALAKKFGLSTAEKKDSTGICFIGERNFSHFLHQHIPYTPGNFETLDRRIVGTHQGVAYYTIGQRRGLGLGGEGEPWFVVGKDVERNVVIVERGTRHPALFADTLTAHTISWVDGIGPRLPYSCTCKIRYRQADTECTIEKEEDGRLFVHFANPQRAITPEQSIVFYSKNECLGGAIIEERGPSHFEQMKWLPQK